MVRFLASVIVTLVGLAFFAYLLRKPKPEEPATWAQCMAGAMGVFGLFLLGYGVVPHEWLTWADSDLGLREDKLLWDNAVIDISGRALRDVVAATIYIVLLGLNVAVWIMWQKRGQAKPKAAPATAPVGTSAFSRPVSKKD